MRKINIFEAVTEAIKTGKCISLPEFMPDVKIRPTNGIGNCIVIDEKNKKQSQYGWQPTAAQLIREDWEVTN